jgi:glutamine amidotransferase
VIALIDYGAGNLRSVEKALRYLGAPVNLVRQPDQVQNARAMVLPGVGAFDDCLQTLRNQGLLPIIKDFIRSKRPFLGICVGYQALFEGSDEFASQAPGLGTFAGRVVRFPKKTGIKIPQIGWNQVYYARPDCPLFKNIPNNSFFYFVHSYFPQPQDAAIIAGLTTHGVEYASVIWHDTVFATQFHPEKSQKAGIQLLSNFLEFAQIKTAK